MTKLVWNSFGENFFETGVDRGVVYPNFGEGVVWNGLISVKETPTGGEVSSYYVDGVKYLVDVSSDDLILNVSAYTYPEEFAQCDGTLSILSGLYVTQQERIPFDFCYRTKLGNDVDADAYGYKIHLIYQATASPTDRSNETINNTVEPIVFGWDFTTIPIDVPGYKPSAHLIVDSKKTKPDVLTAIEDILYGSDINNPRMISPSELISMYNNGITGDVFVSTFGEYF